MQYTFLLLECVQCASTGNYWNAASFTTPSSYLHFSTFQGETSADISFYFKTSAPYGVFLENLGNTDFIRLELKCTWRLCLCVCPCLLSSFRLLRACSIFSHEPRVLSYLLGSLSPEVVMKILVLMGEYIDACEAGQPRRVLGQTSVRSLSLSILEQIPCGPLWLKVYAKRTKITK